MLVVVAAIVELAELVLMISDSMEDVWWYKVLGVKRQLNKLY